MNIGIIGMGFVGKAVAAANSQFTTIVNDPLYANSVSLDNFINCNVIYVCVPSPQLEDGMCDTSILESTLNNLYSVGITNIPIICKTTAPPSAYAMLHEKYPNIVHCPEFLTAANNITEYVNRTSTILGGNDYWCKQAKNAMFEVNIGHEFVITDINTASLFKYIMNSYLATKVTFMNEFNELATKLGIDWNEIKKCAITDSRIGKTHMQVPGPDGNFGWHGACFPKDISAIMHEAKTNSINMTLLDTIMSTNIQHRKKNEN